MKLSFVVFGTPIPQGSMKSFIPKGWNRAVLTSDNKKQKPWRQEVTRTAIDAAKENGGEIIPRGEAVTVRMEFYLARPASKPKKVTRPTVKPDCDKLARLIFDSMTGVIFEDDSQVCDLIASKHYGIPERVEITVATNNEAVLIHRESLGLFA
jgi:Holliday junction resolvase RusA-like endonuclease